MLTLGTGIGTGVDGKTITFTPTVGTSSITWENSTTVTQAAAKALIKKTNIAGAGTGTGTGTG